MNKQKEEKIEIWLDPTVCRKFREVINSSAIFTHDKELTPHWNLICVVMDRLDDTVAYLNTHIKDRPETCDELIIFMTYSSLVVSAVKELFKEINIQFSPGTTFFENVFTDLKCKRIYNTTGNYACNRNPNYTTQDCKTSACPLENAPKTDYPDDDKFFEYLRSLMFAHPYETSRPKFLLKDEVNYSPFVFAEKRFGGDDYKNPVGLNIYSNKFNWTLHLWFSFDTLKDYVKSRYDMLAEATKWAEERIANAEIEWAKRKVNRTLNSLEMLKDIKSILEERYLETYQEDMAIELLECASTVKENDNAIAKYKEYLISCIPSRCDEIDNLDEEYLYPTPFDAALYPKPKQTHQMFSYQIEKIFNYLQDDNKRFDDVQWGRNMAKLFAQGFAKDYVVIEYETMSPTEIKLLVNTACYLEKLNQENGIISPAILKSLEEQRQHEKTLRVVSRKTIKLPNGEKIVIKVVDAKNKKK